MRAKATIMDKEAIQKAIKRIAHEILEQNKIKADITIIGIKI